MDSLTVVLPPSAEAAATEGVAQAEAETIELSTLSTWSTPIVDATRQRSDNALSSGSQQSQHASATWSIVELPSISTFYSFGPKSSEFLGRYKASKYKNSLKIVGVFCGLGALILAGIALKSPMTPNDIDVQSLAAMNKSAGNQIAMYQVLQESLSKLQQELAIERKQLEADRELLRNEANQLDLQKWAAQRQYIKDCLDFQNVSSAKVLIESYDELKLPRNTI